MRYLALAVVLTLFSALAASAQNLPSPAFATEVSVKSYGAVCDGSTDDSPAFRRAIAALPHGGYVDVPATGHSCVLKEGIVISDGSASGVTLRGVAGLYWPGPYDNTETDWQAFGSWIRCDD
jgi:hypothetical protein